jgi:sugar lactone lactonase YvrE
VARKPPGMGHAIGWLPDGRMLVTGDELRRYEPDGTTVLHADPTRVSKHRWSEMTIDGGNIYVNSIGFDFKEMNERARDPSRGAMGVIALVTPDGNVCKVADEIAFPNGMVITPDHKTPIVAESFTRSLIAFHIGDDGRPRAGVSGLRAKWPRPGRHLPRRRKRDLDVDGQERLGARG